MTMPATTKSIPTVLKRQDFISEQEVRWCPGCGDYAILSTMQKTLPMLGIPKEDIVFVSGIGCSSRFPYYLSTYGFHTIHGRAPTMATGLKLANPDLTVFVVTGDGDGLSIGSNHLMHLIRRNVNVTVLLFNNRIYGLTKGQYSPTSEVGKKTKSSPQGSLEQDLDPVRFALSANASFVARAIDIDAKGLGEIIEKAVKHQGTSFIEIFQNCNVFNDGAFSKIHDKASRAANTLFLRPGEPMIFGESQEKSIFLDDGHLAIDLAGTQKAIMHRENLSEELLWALASKTGADFPVVTGIFKQVQRPVYELQMKERSKSISLSEMMSRQTWQVI